MLKETISWNKAIEMSVSFLVLLIAIFIIMILCAKKNNQSIKPPIFSCLIILIIGIIGFSSFKTTIVELDIVKCQLKESLYIELTNGVRNKVSVEKDSNGTPLFSDDNNRKIKDTYNLKKGDEIKIKTIEEIKGFKKGNKEDWKKAKVFALIDEKLVELDNNDVKAQSIDELVEELYGQ